MKMKKIWYLAGILCTSAISAQENFAFPHSEIKQYSMHGNFQKALASKAMGSHEFEIWRASLAVGSKTPRHVHETEEVFVLLKGEILALIGDQEVRCSAPATLICPANVPHQLINVGLKLVLWNVSKSI